MTKDEALKKIYAYADSLDYVPEQREVYQVLLIPDGTRRQLNYRWELRGELIRRFAKREIEKYVARKGSNIVEKQELIRNTGIIQNFMQHYLSTDFLLSLGIIIPHCMSREYKEQCIIDEIERLGYIPTYNYLKKNGIVPYNFFNGREEYKKFIEMHGYESPKFMYRDYTKDEIVSIVIDNLGNFFQINDIDKCETLPFSTSVIRNKFGSTETFKDYAGIEHTKGVLRNVTDEELISLFHKTYDIDSPPSMDNAVIDFHNGILKYHPSVLSRRFGTWVEYLTACGCKNYRPSLGSPQIAEDGHFCDSKTETLIDNFLFHHSIEHQTHVLYKSLFETKRLWRLDFLLNDGTIVEYFGLAENTRNKKYQTQMSGKLSFLKENKVKYIAIYPNDLRNLENIFSEYINQEVAI